MRADKAIKKTINSQIKILVFNGIENIKQECKKGNYRAKIELSKYFKVDEQVINRFKNLGYDIGSTNDLGDKYYVNIFWNEKELIKDDFVSA